MTGTADRVVVLDVVGLRPDHLTEGAAPRIAEYVDPGATGTLEAPFPAVTVPVQTTLATGRSPSSHGDVANGEYDRKTDTVAFWERDSEERYRLWEQLTEETDLTTGALFMQHLIGSSADVAITPSPIEDENNNLLEMDCWSNPEELYDDLYDEYGHFPLFEYWGPMAGAESSEWILQAARAAIDRADPDLLWIYVPHLDYTGLRDGPESSAHAEALETVDEMVGEFCDWLAGTPRWGETALTVLGEYAFNTVDRPQFPNRALAEAGLLATDEDGDVDLSASAAFAMVDHQLAHVYCDDGHVATVRDALAELDGLDRILDGEGKAAERLDHPNAGDLVLVAEQDAWFQYYWWSDDADAPPYAGEMDIHAKPGFDPCELVPGESGMVSLDPTAVGGSHGRLDERALGVCAFGGPALPADLAVGDRVDARAVAPTIADLLGVSESLDADFEEPSLSGEWSAKDRIKKDRPRRSDMTVTHSDLTFDWLGYATLRVEGPDGTVVYLDPGRYGVLSGDWEPDTPGVGHPPARDYNARDGDLVLVTHDHHYDPDGIRRVAKDDATVVVFEGVSANRIDRDVDRVADLDHETVRVGDEEDRLFGDVVVRTVPAYNHPDGEHLTDAGEPVHPEGLGVGYLFDVAGQTVFWTGDTDRLDGHEALDVDVFVPSISGNYTMDRHTAAELAADLDPDLTLPMHYNTFGGLEADGEAFALDVAKRGVGVALDEET